MDFVGKLRKKIHIKTFDRGLEAFYLRALGKNLSDKNSDRGILGSYYEFGTGSKVVTLCEFLKAANKFYTSHKSEKLKIFAFDSFEGLPAPAVKADQLLSWKKGEYAGSIEHVKNKIDNLKLKINPDITYIKGVYEKTLDEALREKLKNFPPSIITIDVDYYSSTKTVLDWLVPILPSACIFYFDDIWAFAGNPNYGQIKAINEFNVDKKNGTLTPYPILGYASQTFIYSRPEFEYLKL